MDKRFTEGIAFNGAAILDNGKPITITEILDELQQLKLCVFMQQSEQLKDKEVSPFEFWLGTNEYKINGEYIYKNGLICSFKDVITKYRVGLRDRININKLNYFRMKELEKYVDARIKKLEKLKIKNGKNDFNQGQLYQLGAIQSLLQNINN